MPLFLELVRATGEHDPELARAALAGLTAYQAAPRAPAPRANPAVAEAGAARLIDHGGEGPPLVLVPSLINPPRILDLDPKVSLADALARMGRRALLLDWGPAGERRELSVAGHVEHILLPLLSRLDTRPVLLGYCLGGTMAIAASGHLPLAGLVTIAAPWNFRAYPDTAREALDRLWERSRPAARALGMLPIEVLQAAFWSLDPQRTVQKFARFAELDPASDEARRFVELEEWANEGEPLPYPAAEELLDCLFGADLSGRGEWHVAGQAAGIPTGVPMLHCLAADDRIAPSATAPEGLSATIESGHVGMIVGSKRASLHRAIAGFLSGLDA